ncbi:pleckstrin homology domain-containing family M member 1 isoform X1 [Protopterus annectens]|uniref:pleckstrin homology domain-containing family M member 1 isoform X1 n=1 Tax=Protopterus annectens TaxID=7888 RepID=UPI001CFAFB3D|nr:pleckstrin homology domain-containing family M member 1 isoform X1 [Protopterus annectens]
MLSTLMAENGRDANKDVKQRINKKLACSLKALLKRYVTSEAVVTSDDHDANVLCCALEAAFVHGLKTKYVKQEMVFRGKKPGGRISLPQPVFWALLKIITHRDVIAELEQLSFINTDVGRCRAWLRLALNDSLMESYMITLLRERSNLSGFYQPFAVLLDTEECEVLLSYLQGLSSLSFQLSFKSAVLNEWTITPLALAGLCPGSDEEILNCSSTQSKRKEYEDSASQSSESDSIEVQTGNDVDNGGKPVNASDLTSSTLSLDTLEFSQLSSSISSDSLLQANATKTSDRLTEEPWSCDSDLGTASADECSRCLQEILDEYKPVEPPETRTEPIQPSEAKSETSSPEQHNNLPSPPSEVPVEQFPICLSSAVDINKYPPCLEQSVISVPAQTPAPTEPCPPCIGNSEILVSNSEVVSSLQESLRPRKKEKPTKVPKRTKKVITVAAQCSAVQDRTEKCPVISPRLMSPVGMTSSNSWISEEDYHKPLLDEPVKGETSLVATSNLTVTDGSRLVIPETETLLTGRSTSPTEEKQKNFSVVHRRQLGLSNPFRGLIKLGNLERRGQMGIWKHYYCELSPYEFRLYMNSEDRNCSENFSVFRCETISKVNSDGRFELHFPSKKLYLRALSRDEAEDWVDRLREASQMRRTLQEETGEDLNPQLTPVDRADIKNGVLSCGPADLNLKSMASETTFNWTCQTDADLDSIKEAILYMLSEKTWLPFIFSLSLEALKCYKCNKSDKVLCDCCRIETIQDVLPDPSLGSPACFRVKTSSAVLKLQAESSDEAKQWRELIRQVMNSYQETIDEAASAEIGLDESAALLHTLKKRNPLLQHLIALPTEKGLDAQSFKCAGCSNQIGFSSGIPKLCAFSAQYYCKSCHQEIESIIPSRIIHGWDLSKRPVSNQALKVLYEVRNEPLINIENANRTLYEHVEQMTELKRTREKLKLLGDYLITCRSGAIKELHKKLEQRNYLLESPHQYSVADLQQIADGTFESFLQSVIQFSSAHIYHCDLCTQRGFICQFCKRNDIIFPFEFEKTTRCKECKTVFHISCRQGNRPCPLCLYRQKYSGKHFLK